MSHSPEGRAVQVNRSLDSDSLGQIGAAYDVRNEFVEREHTLTSAVSHVISTVGSEEVTQYYVKSKIIPMPIDPETSDGISFYGVRLVQEFMPDDPFHVRKNRIVYVEYSEDGDIDERVVGIRDSFDFCTNGAELQSPVIIRSIREMENDDWFAKQTKFEEVLARIDAIVVFDSILS
ncbi:MAG TPA: hypothetical protein VIH90_06890 [Candidatus Saccharimonadales bacterium]